MCFKNDETDQIVCFNHFITGKFPKEISPKMKNSIFRKMLTSALFDRAANSQKDPMSIKIFKTRNIHLG
jgi:hypothetical protein